jgi:hypothetical protein
MIADDPLATRLARNTRSPLRVTADYNPDTSTWMMANMSLSLIRDQC